MSQQQTNPVTPDDDAQPTARKSVALIIFLTIVLVGGGAGYLYWRHARQYETTDDAFIESDVTPVSSKVAGQVLEVLVADNQPVKAGDVIVRIDPRDLEARVNQQKAAVASAEARLLVAQTNVDLTRTSSESALAEAAAALEGAKAGVSSAQSQVASAKADVAAAQAEADRRTADLKRFEALDRRVVSQQQLDAAKAAADSATANLQAAQKRLAAAESRVTESEAKVTQAQASLKSAAMTAEQLAVAQAQAKAAAAAVEQARAELSAAELNLSYAVVKAPSTGRIARKNVQLGQYLQVGQPILAIVRPLPWVVANFKETQLTRMHVGQHVDVKVDVYPDRSFDAHIESIQSGTGSRFSLLPPENATGNYVKVVQRVPVKIVFKTPVEAGLLLAPGMSVEPRVHVMTGSGEDAPLEPGTQPITQTH